jgi:hypothetical protein
MNYSTVWKSVESGTLYFSKHEESDIIASSADVENCPLDVGFDVGTIWESITETDERLLLSDGQFEVCAGSIKKLELEYDDVLIIALAWAKNAHKTSTPQKQFAFANSVAYLVCGASSGFGGPSVREHAVSHALAGKNGINVGMIQFPDGSLPRAGNWAIAPAIIFAQPICFGELTALHEECWRVEYCFDNDPDDEQYLTLKLGATRTL